MRGPSRYDESLKQALETLGAPAGLLLVLGAPDGPGCAVKGLPHQMLTLAATLRIIADGLELDLRAVFGPRFEQRQQTHAALDRSPEEEAIVLTQLIASFLKTGSDFCLPRAVGLETAVKAMVATSFVMLRANGFDDEGARTQIASLAGQVSAIAQSIVSDAAPPVSASPGKPS